MASINREQMEILVSLQEIQTESNRINKFLSGVDQQKEDLDKQVRDFRKGVDEVEARLDEFVFNAFELSSEERQYIENSIRK